MSGTPERLRVLIIDDDRLAAEGLRQVLVALGHEVTVATGGAAGLDAVLPHRSDVVLCDLGLPDIDGFEIALRLRSDPRTAHVRLVAITGYRRMAASAARAAGFDQYLIKPIEVASLAAALGGSHLG